MVSRFVIRRTGPSASSAPDVASSLRGSGVRVLDVDDLMVLAEGEFDAAAPAISRLDGWQAFEVTRPYAPPQPVRPRLRR